MAETTSKTTAPEELIPIILDAGTRSKKAIDELKDGEGKLMDEVAQLVREARAEGKETGPIVIVYKQKSPTSFTSIMKVPLAPFNNVFGKS